MGNDGSLVMGKVKVHRSQSWVMVSWEMGSKKGSWVICRFIGRRKYKKVSDVNTSRKDTKDTYPGEWGPPHIHSMLIKTNNIINKSKDWIVKDNLFFDMFVHPLHLFSYLSLW
jgi:hypothetical protein